MGKEFFLVLLVTGSPQEPNSSRCTCEQQWQIYSNEMDIDSATAEHANESHIDRMCSHSDTRPCMLG